MKDIADETSNYLESTLGSLSEQNAIDLFKYSNFFHFGATDIPLDQ
jgi:hypothetical protein